MLGAIYIGLSGMNAYSQGLQTISNNVANLNSPGFKATSVRFADIFSYGGAGLAFTRSVEASQWGSGVRFADPSIDYRQGDLRQTEGDLDLAIQGSGFLVLIDGGKTYYARTGSFVVGDDGYIVQEGTSNRLAVLDDGGQPVAINIDSKRTSLPVATTKIEFADNLSSTASTAAVSDIVVYDANGGRQVWRVSFVATGAAAPGEWAVTISDANSATVGTGTLRFIGSVIDPATSTLTVPVNPAGAPAFSVALDFANVRSFSGGTVSTLRAAEVDGRAVGALTAVIVNPEGMLELTYSNSETESLGAVALADFRDPQQLERVGDGLFESRGVAQFRLLSSGTDGVGKLLSKQFEASNVDLSQQFGDLILIQRGFQASSQVVSVSNDMIQQLFGIRGQG